MRCSGGCVSRFGFLVDLSANPTRFEITRNEFLADFRSSRFALRFRRSCFPRAWPLLAGSAFTNSRFGFLFFCRDRLPWFYAFLTKLPFVQIPSEPLVSKTAPEPGSSNCQRSCDLNGPAARCHVPWTFGQRIFIRKIEPASRCITLTRHNWLSR